MDRNRMEEFKTACADVPTVQCANELQKEAFTNAYFAACDLIGGLENTFNDYESDDPEYIAAEKYLSMHDDVVTDIYKMTTTGFYGCGYAGPGNQKQNRFAGKQFTMDAIEKIVKAMGY